MTSASIAAATAAEQASYGNDDAADEFDEEEESEEAYSDSFTLSAARTSGMFKYWSTALPAS